MQPYLRREAAKSQSAASLALFAGLIDTEGAYASYSLGAVNAYRINVEADP